MNKQKVKMLQWGITLAVFSQKQPAVLAESIYKQRALRRVPFLYCVIHTT